MKKKGLIISTIVMVVVLVASLSTATYAWFSSTAKAAIEGVTINSRAAEGLQIASYYFDAGANQSHFYSGNLELNANNVWTGKTEAPGNNLQFDATTGGLKNGFFASSGDGLNMWTAGAMADKIIETPVDATTTLTKDTTVLYGHRNAAGDVLATNTKLGASTGLTNENGVWIADATTATAEQIATLKNLGTVGGAVAYDEIYLSNEKVATENAPGSLDPNGVPKALVKATPNQAYFTVDIAVKLTAKYEPGANDALVIKDLTLTGTKYMGAATRFALFQYNGGVGALETPTTNAIGTPLTTDNALFVIEPYSTSRYSGGWETDPNHPETKYIKDATPISGSTGLYTYPTDKTDMSKWAAMSTTYANKFYRNQSDLTAPNVPPITFSEIKTGLASVVKENNIHCGTFSATGQIVYLKMVIWFDGEDTEAVNLFANQTGLGIRIEFASAAKLTT